MRVLTASLQLLILAMLASFGGQGRTETLTCQQAHQIAVNKCLSYQHQISAESLESLSYETRIRAAHTERSRTLAMGRACAEVQRLCSNLCARQTEVDIVEGNDWALSLDLGTDCREGEVAKHRAIMAQRYKAFSEMLSQKIVRADIEL